METPGTRHAVPLSLGIVLACTDTAWAQGIRLMLLVEPAGRAGPLGTVFEYEASCHLTTSIPALAPEQLLALLLALLAAGIWSRRRVGLLECGLLALGIAASLELLPVTAAGSSNCGEDVRWEARSERERFTGEGAAFSIAPRHAGQFNIELRYRDAVASTTLEVQAPCGAGVALDSYIAGKSCTGNGCLERMTRNACASGCPRHGYNLSSETPERLEIHNSLKYLQLLRNAVEACPGYTSARTLEMSVSDLLWHQVQMTLLHESVRLYDAAGGTLDWSEVKAGHTVDSSRFDWLTWVNEPPGQRPPVAHAMTQGDLGGWALTVAQVHAAAGRLADMAFYLHLSRAAFRSFNRRAADGGVRNNLRGHRCQLQTHFCYWFHSQPAEDYHHPSTVLNQHLHAVRDALVAYRTLAAWRASGYASVPLPGEFHRPAPGETQGHVEQLFDWARGGLAQLAFGERHPPSVDSSLPPNLRDFLQPMQIVNGQQRYRAHYYYWLSPVTFPWKDPPDFDEGPRNIARSNTCHYHFHSLEVFAEILSTIRADASLHDHPRLRPIYYKLLYGREPGDSRTCSNRSVIPPSRRVMNGVPLAEIFMGGALRLDFHGDCAGNYADEPRQFRDGETAGRAFFGGPGYAPGADGVPAYDDRCIFE